jgi:hypothetical protein
LAGYISHNLAALVLRKLNPIIPKKRRIVIIAMEIVAYTGITRFSPSIT